MGLSEAQKVGMGENVKELLVKERPALERGNLDVNGAIASLDSALKAAITANALQHDLKREAMAATVLSVDMSQHLYVTASSILDMAIGAVSKDSPAAKEFRTLRSRIARPPLEPGEPTTPGEPAPEPTA